MFSFVANKSLIASVLAVSVPMTGIITFNYMKKESTSSESLIHDILSNTVVEDNKYIIYATNPDVVNDFEESNWGDNNKYFVQLLGDEQWIECNINVITVDSEVKRGGSTDTVANTLKVAHSILEITVTGNLDVNWQTNSIKIKQKSVEKTKETKVVTLNFLCAKHQNSWIGKTNYFVGTADEAATTTTDDKKKFTYCQINKSDCKSNVIHELTAVATSAVPGVAIEGNAAVEAENPFGLNLISKVATTVPAPQPPTTISLIAATEYLIEFDEDDKQNISVNNEIIIHGTDKSPKSHFSKIKPVISLGNNKFFDFVSRKLEETKTSEQNEEYVIYATNKEAVADFVVSSDKTNKNYSCALRGSNLWADCSISTHNSTGKTFETTTDIPNYLNAVNKVVEIKVSKNIDLNWQSEKIKIKPKSVEGDKTIKEANLTILVSKDGDKNIGRTKYFVGKSGVAQTPVTSDSKCTINKITYEKCNIYDSSSEHDKDEYKFETLSEAIKDKAKSTSWTEGKHYLIEVNDMDDQKMDIVRKDINFALTKDQKKPTFVDIQCASYDELSKFFASLTAKKFDVEPEVAETKPLVPGGDSPTS